MSPELSAPQKRPETIGRGGINIPEIDAARLGMTSFFSRLFEANGVELEVGEDFDRKELVVPASDEKPLVVLVAEYDPTKDPDYSRDDFGYSDWKLEGTEIYSVLVPPAEAGPFEVVMKVSQGNFSGHGLSYPGEEIEVDGEEPGYFATYEEFEANLKSKAQQVIDLIS